MSIENPTLSSCGRFLVSPEQYGFAIIETGGGCTAWHKELEADAHIVLTAGDDGASHELGEHGEMFTLGLYANYLDNDGTLFEMKVGRMPEDEDHNEAVAAND